MPVRLTQTQRIALQWLKRNHGSDFEMDLPTSPSVGRKLAALGLVTRELIGGRIMLRLTDFGREALKGEPR